MLTLLLITMGVFFAFGFLVGYNLENEERKNK